MSVGHVARLLEDAGIPTVTVAVKSFQSRMKIMSLPRVLITPHPMGRPIGPPGNREVQRKVVREALLLLETAKGNGTMEVSKTAYRFTVWSS